jgi:FkbM family methyltransferase
MNRVLGMIRNVRNFPTYLAIKWGLIKREPFILKGGNNVSVLVPKRMFHTVKELFFTDDYQLDRIKETLKTESLNIIDVGANVGYFSAFAFTRFPKARVISVEPIPKNLALLKANQERNADKNWEFIEGVMSNVTENIEITFDDADDFSTSASVVGLDDGSDKLTVKAFSFEDFLGKHGMEKVDILKLDCEGSEYNILCELNDEMLQKIQFITMETHDLDEERNTATMIQFLEKNDWTVSAKRTKVLARNNRFK